MSDIDIIRDDSGRIVGIDYDVDFIVECGEDGVSLPNITLKENSNE